MNTWDQNFDTTAQTSAGLQIFGPYTDFRRARPILLNYNGSGSIEVELNPRGRLRRFVYLPGNLDRSNAVAVVMVAGSPDKPHANPVFFVATSSSNPLEGQSYATGQLFGPTESKPDLAGRAGPDRLDEFALMILAHSQAEPAALTDQRGTNGAVATKSPPPAQEHRTLLCSRQDFNTTMRDLKMYHSFGKSKSRLPDTWQNQSGRYAEGVVTFYQGMVWTYRRCPQELSDSDATPWIVEGLLRHGATPLPNDVYNLDTLLPPLVGRPDSDLDELLSYFTVLQISE